MAKVINAQLLDTLGVGFNAAFMDALGQAPTDHEAFTETVMSTTGRNEFAWMDLLPNVRKWLGDRVVQNISLSKYELVNDDYELTVAVKANDIDDDNIGVYGTLFKAQGRAAGAHTCRSMFDLLVGGFVNPCYDGQNYFDTDHAVLDVNGVVQSVANTDGGAGEPWFMLDTMQAIKPLIHQKRQDWRFIPKDQPTDDNVFNRKEYVYGMDARCAFGYSLWQLAWGSKQAATAANYKLARENMIGMKGDFGRPLGIMPRLVVCGPRNESAFRKLLNSEYGEGGVTNEWKGTCGLLVSPWLA